MFNMSSKDCRDFAHRVVQHIAGSEGSPENATQWTARNLGALRTFAKSYAADCVTYLSRKHDPTDEKKGEYLFFDFLAYVPKKGFLIAAETEFDNKTIESLQGDFEKLLYLHAPCKIMMCRASDPHHAAHIAAQLSYYANDVCDQFSPGEVFVLFFPNYGSGDMEELSFYWQVPGEPHPQCLEPFRFVPMLSQQPL